MMRISRFAILLALLGLAACNGSGAAEKTRPDNKPEDGQTTAELPGGGERPVAAKPASAVVTADFLYLNAVRLNPAAVNAAVDISAEVEVMPPVPEGIEFEYRWFVSNRKVDTATGSTLKSGNFRKHQWIICQARAMAGEKVSAWLPSNWLRIANSPPQIEPVAVNGFNVPGRFTYQITASDADNDELTYALLAPLDAGIALDKKSGLLTWTLDNALVEKLGEKVDILLSVSDNDAPPVTGSLTLHFKKSEAKNQ